MGSLQFGAVMNDTVTNTIAVCITIDIMLVTFDFSKVPTAWFISAEHLPTLLTYLHC